jgi:antitoxin component YwqK of YwqJK toxin-antitoxin module
MRILIPFLLILFALPSFAQETVYYDNTPMRADKANAKAYAVFVKNGDGYKAEEYSMDGILKTIGHYSRIDSSLHSSREGYFIYYDSLGAKTHEGVFIGNMRSGIWKYYWSGGIQLKHELTYFNDIRSGRGRMYNRGQVLLEDGNYSNDEKQGLWKYYAGNKLLFECHYENGKVEGEKVDYDGLGHVIKRTTYANGMLI